MSKKNNKFRLNVPELNTEESEQDILNEELSIEDLRNQQLKDESKIFHRIKKYSFYGISIICGMVVVIYIAHLVIPVLQ